MLDIKQFVSALQQIAEEKGIPEDKIMETIELAIAAAYKKDYGEKAQIIRVKMKQSDGSFTVTRIRLVVEGVDDEGYITGPLPEQPGFHDRGAKDADDQEEVKVKFNEEKHILLEEAVKENPDVKVGDEIIIKLETKTDFGRIAAQTAKQVIIQRLREIERDTIMEEFREKENEVVSGIVQRVEGRLVYIDLGRTNGIVPPAEQIPGEHYRIGQRAKFFIVRVEQTNRGPAIILSRSHPQFVINLFEFEVPEMETGEVEIRAIAREAGSRSKVAVTSNDESIDPIGSLVGQKGVRVQTVINELGGEKIDIIEYSDDPQTFIAKALAPAKILDVSIEDEQERHATAEVADDQFSLAIGKRGQNVRLAAKLTGWKLDVRAPESEMTAQEAQEQAQDENEPANEELSEQTTEESAA